MLATAKILLDTRREKQDKTYPVVIRICHKRKITHINLNISIRKKDWDANKCSIKRTCDKYENLARINNIIRKKYSIISDKIMRLHDRDRLRGMTIGALKDHLIDRRGNVSFCEYASQLVKSMERKGQIGNAQVYKHAISFIKRYNKGKDILFEEITYKFLEKIEEDYLAQGKSPNGLSTQMRTIRAIYNKAAIEELADKKTNPFEYYKIKNIETRKRAISKESIKKIECIQLEEDSSLWHAKNYFLFSFYCRGMNFIDIAKLRLGQISEDRIYYFRSKSKNRKLINIGMHPKIKGILDLYIPFIENPTKESFVFPIVKRGDAKGERVDIENARRLFNNNLKRIAVMTGIDENLTAYVARHTWASTANKMKIMRSIIGDGMGHSDAKTTSIYLDQLGNDVIDEANAKVIE